MQYDDLEKLTPRLRGQVALALQFREPARSTEMAADVRELRTEFNRIADNLSSMLETFDTDELRGGREDVIAAQRGVVANLREKVAAYDRLIAALESSGT